MGKGEFGEGGGYSVRMPQMRETEEGDEEKKGQ
jgi:hypothetical protein